MKEHIYKVSGMHCASCEILIEKQFLTLEGVKSAEASTGKGEVVIEYEGNRPSPERLNRIFKAENYVFSDLNGTPIAPKPVKKSGFFSSLGIGLVLIAIFLWLNKIGLADWLNVSSGSSLPTFFVFGLLAGISSCAALVGGLILSMSKQWSELYAAETSTVKKLQPHILFNSGRVISYLFFGSILGLLGSTFQLSLKFTSILIIAVSILMLAIAMQMLDVGFFRKFQLSLPKSMTRYVANEKNFKGKNMPFFMGALTFFLPCGFTITSQGLALLSGSPLQGSLIMGFFALGTTIPLLAIGLSSVAFSKNPHWADRFSKIAGIVVLFFALFNINSQLAVLGYNNINDLVPVKNTTQSIDNGLPPIIDGKQVIKMIASGSGDDPNYFKVKAGVPVRWEITGGNSLGCNNGIISANLFEGQITLTPGQVSVKEFTPSTAGRYKFSCGMGMITGIIEVIN